MGIHSFRREELGKAPLDINTFYRIRIVAAPELCEIFKRFVIATGTTTGTKHHRDIRIILLHTFQDIIDTADMVNIQLSLFILQIRRIDIGDRTVAIPFEESNFGILLHYILYNTIYIILHLRIAKVKYQLVTVIIRFTIRQCDRPVRMFLEEFTLGIHHFGFNPDTELHICILGSFHQRRNATGQFIVIHIPVSQTRMIILTGIFVRKPTIVQQEHIYTQMLGFLH